MDIIDENGDLLDFYVFLYSWKISWFSLEDWWHALQIIEELDKSEETVVNILEGSKIPRESAQTKEFKAERETQKIILKKKLWKKRLCQSSSVKNSRLYQDFNVGVSSERLCFHFWEDKNGKG